MTFTSAPLSGSAVTSPSSNFTDTVLSSPLVLTFFTCLKCLTAWQKNSSQVLIGTLNHSTWTVHLCYVRIKSDRAIAVVNVIIELCDLCDYFASLLLIALSYRQGKIISHTYS